MSTGVEFGDSSPAASSQPVIYQSAVPPNTVPHLALLPLRLRLAKTQQQSLYATFGVALIFFVASVYLFGHALGWFSHPKQICLEHVSPQFLLTLSPEQQRAIPHCHGN